MPQLTLAQIAVIVGGTPHINCPEKATISHLVLDSRKQMIQAESLFFAINGINHNGHKFIQEAHAKGIDNFVVSEPQNNPNINYILVDDVVAALQKLAHYNRRQFKGKVVGITGSNGKTIVKEWLAQLLTKQAEVYKSPRSYNSQVGVPLSLWGIKPNADFALIEAGISKAGEMQKLADIVAPEIGILTHLGSAHENGFDNPLHKRKEKLKLFKNCQLLIFNDRQQGVTKDIKNILPDVPKFIWSAVRKEVDLYVEKWIIANKRTTIIAHYQNAEYQIDIPFTDKASIENCISCWAALIAITGKANWGKTFMQLSPINMRLQSVAGANNCHLISDCYNADWDSFEAAYEALLALPHSNKSIIITEFEGHKNFLRWQHRFHDVVSSVLLKKLLLIGNWDKNLFADALHFDTAEAALAALANLIFKDEAVLIKGARAYRLERLVDALAQQKHETQLSIKLDALVHNLNVFRAYLPSNCQLMVMVKAFAYGAGNVEIARLLQHHKVDYLAVAYADEGVALRQAGIHLPIMVMNCAVDNYGTMVRYSLEPQIHNAQQWRQWAATPKPSTLGAHLKLDTGMGRLGFQQNDLDAIIQLVENQPIKLASCLTHLAASNDAEHDAFTNKQLKLFQQLTAKIEAVSAQKMLKHAFNSAAINRFKLDENSGHSLVRLGIGLYGIGAVFNNWHLEMGVELRSYILQIKSIAKGQSVGYNRAWVAPQNSRIAVVGIGYADGLPRLAGNGNFKLKVKGKTYPIIGDVCMDMCMINIGDADIKEGESVLIFEGQADLERLAAAAQTIAYEVIARISQRVKRVYIKEG